MGLAYMLLALWALAAGRYRLCGLLAGFAPAVHLGQFPPLLGVLLLFGFLQLRKGSEQPLRQLLCWMLPGLLISVGLWFFVQHIAVGPPIEGPYASAIDPQAVWTGYMKHHASHRRVPFATGHIALAAMVLFGFGLIRSARSAANQPSVNAHAWTWSATYGFITATTVWAIMAIHLSFAEDIPFVLIAWMPYRLMNHATLLLIPILVSILATSRSPIVPTAFYILAVVCVCTRPLLGSVLHSALFERYLASGAWFYFLLMGAAASALWAQLRANEKSGGAWLSAVLIALIALAPQHQFGAFCGASGFLLERLLSKAPRRFKPRPAAASALCVLAVAVMLLQQGINREHLPISEFEREVRQYLHERDQDDAMILVRHHQEGLQARLHHPVMTDMASMNLIPYNVALGPSSYKVYRDFYGINFAPAPGEPAIERPWHEVWPAMQREDWVRLGAEYDLCYVLAPAFMELELPRVIEGQTEHLYQIPRKTNASAGER